MERSRRLYEIWNWLVPFRVAAESESLSEASKHLHVASSAISRSVKLLEERVGVKFFDRHPGSILLNDAGRHFLSATRAAMRLMDDALEELGTPLRARTITVASCGEYIWKHLPRIRELRRDYPGLTVQLTELSEEDAILGLRQGRVDLAIVSDRVSDEELLFRPLPEEDRAIFASPEHPACARRVDSLDELEFAVSTDSAGTSTDGFPNHIPRTVVLRCSSRAMVIDALMTDWPVACLPRSVAESAGLVELALPRALKKSLSSSRMVLAQRPPLSDRPSPHELLAEAILRGG